uniref:TPR repeat region-containing protein n=1 Tax=Nocardia niigatensis TaxID=209249 RepID=UPI0002F7E0DC
MATPSKSTVMGWLVDLGNLAPTIESIAKGVRDNASSMHKTIDGMNWSGKGRDGADGRVDRERQQMGVVADAFDDLATACRNGQSALEPMVASARQTVTHLNGDFYKVSEDWYVEDTYNYAEALLLAGSQQVKDQINQLQIDRKNEAANQTVALQRLAADIGAADDAIATALSTALASIEQLTPASAGLNPVAAQQDLDAWKNGKATPDQLERLQLATQLTPDQLQDLLNGKDVDLPQERFDYLRSLMRGMDGMSVSDISQFGDKLPADKRGTLETGLVDAMQLMSNPQIKTVGDDKVEDQGGMIQLPTQVQTLLKENPVRRSEKAPASEFAANFIDIPHEGDFNTFVDLLGKGNPGLAQGSDLDRGLLKQGAEIGAATANNLVLEPKPHGATDLADRMLNQAGGDRLAVHDLLYGTNMQCTVTDGGHYDAPSHVADLLGRDWHGHEDGVSKVIESAGRYATSADPTLNQQSGEASWALANYASTHAHDLLHLDGGDQSIGMVDPKMTKALGQTLASYIPDMVGTTEGAFGTHGFGAIDQANVKNIFAVIDSNKDAAVDFNRAAYVSIAQMNQAFGAHGGTNYALGEWAGRIDAAAQSGMQLELDGRKMDQATQLKYEQTIFDSVKDIAAFGGKHIPRLGIPALGGSNSLPMGFSISDFTELGVKVAAPEVKNWLFGAVPELGPNADLDGYGSQSKRFYNILQGMTLTSDHPDYSKDPNIGRYFDSNGNLMSFYDIKRLDGMNGANSLPMFKEKMKDFLPGLLAYDDGWNSGHSQSEQHPR